jgi:L-alanine-DL-glutamate epimerase-like enolase superfamily enzyme
VCRIIVIADIRRILSKIGDDPMLDAARIEAALADRQPGEYYIVDANGGMTVETASRMLRLLPPGLDFVLEAACATCESRLVFKGHYQRHR